MVPAVFAYLTAMLFTHNVLRATTMTVAWLVIFF